MADSMTGARLLLSLARQTRRRLAPVRFERELRLSAAFARAATFLDVGCSTGGFLHQLSTRFPDKYRGIGVDVAGKALDYAESRGVAVKRGSLLELDFAGQRFDAITFWAVLEHLAEPVPFVSKAAALLRSGGYLFILVPNMRSLAVRVLGRRYRYILPEHLNYFTAQTLTRLTTAQKELEVVALQSMHFNPVVLWQDFWRDTSEMPDLQRAQLLRRTTAWKQKRAFWPIRQLYSGIERTLGACLLADNLALVLRKPQP
jgi:2-polyprenyl-3-methyl-5-hydroxy-6-metoxy-1,4-benzoquinol methylase